MKLISWYCHSFWISRMRFKLYIVDSMNSRHFSKVRKRFIFSENMKMSTLVNYVTIQDTVILLSPPPHCVCQSPQICHNSFLTCDLLELISKITWVLGRISINGIISWNKSESFNLIDFAVHREVIRKWENYLLHPILASLLSNP